MNGFRVKQEKEAIERLQILEKTCGLMPHICEDFEANRTLYYTANEYSLIDGSLFWLSNNEALEEIVKDFETSHNAVVYHCIYAQTEYGNMLNMLFVGKYPENWDNEKFLMQYSNRTFARVYNLDNDELSDFGNITVSGLNGGVIRRM